jgi:hypothetical protein
VRSFIVVAFVLDFILDIGVDRVLLVFVPVLVFVFSLFIVFVVIIIVAIVGIFIVVAF